MPSIVKLEREDENHRPQKFKNKFLGERFLKKIKKNMIKK